MPLPAFLVTALKAAPAVANAALDVFRAIRLSNEKERPSTDDEIETLFEELFNELDELRAHSERQAEIVSQMAKQLEALSESVQFLSRRISLINLSLLGSSMIAVTALILVILWS